MLAEQTQDVPWQVDFNGSIIYIGQSVKQWGFNQEDLLGHSLFNFIHSNDVEKVKRSLNNIFNANVLNGLMRIRLRTAASGFAEIELSASPIFDKLGEVIGCHGIARDITDRIKVESKLRHFASIDVLTGLLNRRAFYRRIDYSRRNNILFNQGIALFFLDVDNFKNINDDLGHTIGDKCLKTIANVLSSIVRDTDSAGRLGGDEFALLVNPADISTVKRICERIILKIKEACQAINLENHPLTISMGVCFAKGNMRISNIVHSADKAMYTAKNNGKNQYYILEDE